MKQILLILAVVAVVAVVGCGESKEPQVVPEKLIIDPIVDKAIRYKLTLYKGNELTKADLEKVEMLSFGLYQLTDMPKGLEKLTKLKEVELWSNQLTSVKGLEKLTQLTRLDLYNNSDLTKAQVDELQKALPKCRIGSNPPLTKEESAKVIEAAIREEIKKPEGELTKADLEKVTYLHLYFDQLTDVAALTDVTALKELTQLTMLYLSRNQLTDVKGLEKLTQLTRLDLDHNKLTDVKGLEKLTKLTGLHLDGNQLTSVKGLEKLTQLERLFLRSNPDLTKAQIDELQKTLPKCEIWSNAKK